jgi:nucleoid-associated protein YgaU
VRVGPEGRAVIAGQAQPGAEVVVRDGGGEVARARADSQGAFVALPAEPLKPGGRALTLASRSEGQAEVKGDGEVVLVVPQVSSPGPPPTAVIAPATAPSAVAVLVPDTGAPRVLQEAPGARGLASPGPTLDRVDYDDKGAIRFTGGAGPAATVRVYVDNLAVGDAPADSSGRWRLVPSIDVAAGMHSLRVDALGEGGRVVGRIELPFQRSVVSASEIAASGGRVVVQPGQNLWRLARAAYGRGVQYTVIYLANRDQIRDPRRIYPGQTFAVPSGGPASH